MCVFCDYAIYGMLIGMRFERMESERVGRGVSRRCDYKCGTVVVWLRCGHRFLGYREYDLICSVCAFN